jgi:tetratricopeptide (TPR) repeat protein
MPMTASIPFRRWRWKALFLVAILAAPAAYSEVGSTEPELGPGTLLGNYLAGRVARNDHDTAAAADFYARALAEDPKNELILEQTFLLETASADWDKAIELAKQLVKLESSHRIAQFLLGLDAFKHGRYQEADDHFSAARQGPIADLASILARAWVQQASGKTDKALATLDSLSDADWAQFYQRYHRGLIADVAGKRDTARNAFASAFKKSPVTLRVAEAYARHAVNSRNPKLAKQTLKTHMSKAAPHPLTTALLAEIEAGEKPELLVGTPSDGLAEVFYGIGDALAGEGGVDMGIIFLQFALYVKPDFPLAQLALASAYDSAKKFDLELVAFDKIPEDSPLWLSIQIQKAFALNSLERVDEAKELLEKIIAENPKDIRPLDALGNILRSRERYAEARDYYSRALALIDKPSKENWALFYARGVCSERLKDWPAAEADLKQALTLSPDESSVLNYLGYTWVDQNQNLKTAMDYIRKAVKLKPDDGYYVDSLGWAYYRLGNLQAAVEHLERAVELRPDDPVINDHLGDVYWQIGRKFEAKYQWQQSLTLKPDKDLVVAVERKLKDGLAAGNETKAAGAMVQPGQKVAE